MRDHLSQQPYRRAMYWHTLNAVDLTPRVAAADLSTISDDHKRLLDIA